MRIRQVKPAYWSDEPLSRLSDGARLFYVGLWMLADDAGWLDWNVPEIGGELYRYRGKAARERLVVKYATELTALNGSERVIFHPCGHAYLPHLTEHQHLPGPAGRAEGVAKRHATRCHAEPRDATLGKVGNGRVVNGSGETPETTNLPPPILEKLRAHGRTT